MRKVLSNSGKLILILLLSIVSSMYIYNSSVKKFKNGVEFKQKYESLNGTVSKSGKNYRSVNIPKDNMMEEISLYQVNKMTKSKKTFYVYFGFKGCPWCRSIIEQMIKVAKENKIKKIYYVDVRPEDDEINDIRDEYSLNENNEVYLSRKGTKDYKLFLKTYKKVLKDYTHGSIKSLANTKFAGEKRLGAPNIIYVKRGVPQKMITGISKKQTDGFMQLNNDILTDEYIAFNNFFRK